MYDVMRREEVQDWDLWLTMMEQGKYGMFFFFFKQKTAYEIYQCDWSSDVCSSDLIVELGQ